MEYLGVVISKNSIESEWIKKELRMALNKEISQNRVVVLPIVIEECIIPGFLQEKRYADFRNLDNYNVALHALIRSIIRSANHHSR